MNYASELIEAHFEKRYKRFFADVTIDGGTGTASQTIVAHVPNTGSLKGICDEPRPCRVLKNNDPKRKLQYTLEQIQVGPTWVGVNTHRANDFVWEAFTEKRLPHWRKFIDGAREVKISPESRLDMRLVGTDGKAHFVEVKSVTLAEGRVAMFPDSPTERGRKHLLDLIQLKNSGATAEIFFAVQRGDCDSFCSAKKIDSTYANLLHTAHEHGIIVSAYQIGLGNKQSMLQSSTPLDLCF